MSFVFVQKRHGGSEASWLLFSTTTERAALLSKIPAGSVASWLLGIVKEESAMLVSKIPAGSSVSLFPSK